MRFPKRVIFLITLIAMVAEARLGFGAAGDQTISGSVVFEDGGGCARCRVTLEFMGLNPVATTFTDSDGRFNFLGIRRGSYVLYVEGDNIEDTRYNLETDTGLQFPPDTMVFVKRLRITRAPNDSSTIDVSQFLSAYPKKAVSLFNRAVDRRRKKDEVKAARLLEQSLEIAPDFYAAHNELGLSYKALGRYEDAEREFMRAHTLNGNSADPLVNLTSLYIDTDRPDQAVTTGEEAVKANGRSAFAFFNLGIALYRISNLDKAEAALKKALELAPKMFQVRLMLANVYGKLRRYDSLMEQLNGYLDENPDASDRPAVEAMRAKVMRAQIEQK